MNIVLLKMRFWNIIPAGTILILKQTVLQKPADGPGLLGMQVPYPTGQGR